MTKTPMTLISGIDKNQLMRIDLESIWESFLEGFAWKFFSYKN